MFSHLVTPLPFASCSSAGWAVTKLEAFATFILLYGYLIPISLYVTLELQKLFGGLLISWDAEMYDPELKEMAQARTSGKPIGIGGGL